MTMAEYLQQKGRIEGEQRGREAALIEGEQKGLYEAAISIAKNMLAKGLEIDLIQSTTNLSEEEIKKLMY